MDYSLLVGIHNCDATADQQQAQQRPLDLGDSQAAEVCVHGNSSDESSGSEPTPPESPLLLHGNKTVSFGADLDPCLESFAIKSAEGELLLMLPLNDNWVVIIARDDGFGGDGCSEDDLDHFSAFCQSRVRVVNVISTCCWHGCLKMRMDLFFHYPLLTNDYDVSESPALKAIRYFLKYY